MLTGGLGDADRHHYEAATVVLHGLLNSESARTENKRRQSVVEWIDGLSTKLLGIRALPVGASLSNTSPLISNEEVELTLFFDKNDNPRGDRWYLTLYEALCNHSDEDKDKMNAWRFPTSTTVERISFFTGLQKLEAVVDGSIVSIKPNDICSLVFACLLDDFDKAVGGKSLLKRSILLIKAWCIYEAPLLRPNDAKGDLTGAFNSCLCMLRCDKVIEVMVMALCSSNILYDSSSDPIQEPFKVLMRFLDIFSRFDWINYAVSVTGLIVLPSSSVPSELRDEDTGTETDSPMYSSAPSPLSSTSCESEACTYPVVGSSNLSAKLSAIVDKYRVRMSLTSLSDDIDDQGPHRLHSVDTDVEDDSFCDERDKQKRGLRINTHKDQVAGFPRMRSDMEHIAPGGGLRGMHALLSESDIKMVSLSRTGLIVLDPTKGYSNLCTTNTTAVTPDTHLVHQECLKSMFASGLSTIRQSLDATDIALKDSCFEEVCSASGEADMMRGTNTSAAEVMKIVRQIFPAMSEMTALKESMMAFTSGAGIDGSVLPNLVQNSTVHLSSTLRYAENAISSKIKTAPTVINDQAGASYLRYKGNNHENETVTSAMMHPTLTKQSDNDVLGLSEISISKSFSSFESDIGLSNDYSISLSGDQSTDAARRFLSAYSPTDLTPSVSYDAYLSRPQNLGPGCVVHSDHIRSDSFSTTGVSYQRDSNQHFLQPGSKILSTSSLDHTKSPIVTGEVYHQHQKTLMRHTQNIPQIIPGHSQSAPCLVRPPVVAMPSRVGENQQETMSNVSAHQPIKAQVPPPVPTISGKLLSPPFIQPFVVKEMQVWVPGKFGSSNSSPATTKIPTQTPQVAKPVGYPKVAYPANGGHMSVGGQVQGQGQGQGQGGLAGRYSPVLQGSSPRAAQNYMYPTPEEEYDVTWIDQPEESHSRIKANRIALAGHLQMQGQLRDRQRPNTMSSDHMSSSQYTGSGSLSGSSRPIGRSPTSDIDSASPHGHSPPLSASSPFGSMQVKRSPSNPGIVGQQGSRLNYGISSGVSVVGSRSSISPMLREGSPPGFNSSKNGFDSNDYDSWSLSSQQHLNQQTLNMSSETSPFAGLSGINSRPFGLADQHAEQRRALLLQQQQQLQAQQRMVQMGSEKSRSVLSASQKEKSEAQLPSFLRDL